jgi:uncharacterized protein involved in outer membrane biogenesis
MSRFRRYGKIAAVVVALIAVSQAAVSFLLKTARMRGYLTTHLETSFGRPVQVGRFSMQVLPIPELDAEGVIIGEDPAFGHEYFLRAERMTARFRWSGLLRGHFEFGTMSLTRPSLILVRTAEGRWNLERWLPPAKPSGAFAGAVAGPQLPAESTHHLQKIEFDDGRINFKQGDEKKPFAFTNVSGNVEQVSPGRWELRLEAQPWRSGALLQSTGTLYVRGDVAGTSARLQPAEIHLHWERGSLADLFRLVTGNDPGVRGTFALDGKASVGKAGTGTESGAGRWRFELRARATQVHRWDLTERADDPRVNVNLAGFWDLGEGEAHAEELRIEGPRSHIQGAALVKTAGPPEWQAALGAASVGAEDLMAWYRAFHPGVAEEVAVEGLLEGSAILRGAPLRWEEFALRSEGATVRVPGMNVAARIEPFHSSMRGGSFVLENVRLQFEGKGTERAATEKTDKTGGKATPLANPDDAIEAALTEDSALAQGELRLNLRFADVAPIFKLTSSFGRTLNRGWEYAGSASGSVSWSWNRLTREMHRNGSIDLTRGQLQVAGLNQPPLLEDVRLNWSDSRRSATIGGLEAFDAAWTGRIEETTPEGAEGDKRWQFRLHADHVDATELDRWFGPRGRPNWVERLLTSFRGGQNTAAKASELVRQVSAEGVLAADTVTIEKVRLTKAQAKVALRDLQLRIEDAEAEWAGGSVRGQMQALFSPVPKYEAAAEFEHVNVAELPWLAKGADRWNGVASGSVQLTTGGVGREELLRQLAGQGQVKLKAIEFLGWDVETSQETGAIHKGTSRWTTGKGKFIVGERALRFSGVELDAAHSKTLLLGSIDFALESNLVFRAAPSEKRIPRAPGESLLVQVSGPMAAPLVIVEPVTAPSPAKP